MAKPHMTVLGCLASLLLLGSVATADEGQKHWEDVQITLKSLVEDKALRNTLTERRERLSLGSFELASFGSPLDLGPFRGTLYLDRHGLVIEGVERKRDYSDRVAQSQAGWMSSNKNVNYRHRITLSGWGRLAGRRPLDRAQFQHLSPARLQQIARSYVHQHAK